MDPEQTPQVNAKDYIAQHKLESVMADMMNTMVYERARKPEIFMVNF